MELEVLRKQMEEFTKEQVETGNKIRSARQEQSDIINRHPEIIKLTKKQVETENHLRSIRQEQSDIINRHPEIIRLNVEINQLVLKRNKGAGSIDTLKELIKIEEEDRGIVVETKPTERKKCVKKKEEPE